VQENIKKNFSYYVEAYWDIFVGILAIIVAFYFHEHGQKVISTLFAAIGIGVLSITVSEIAEILSERLHEPYGSFVLTISAVVVEILLLYIILLQVHHSPEVINTVKGSIISAVIVDMNVLLGFAIFLGGLNFTEQEHNKETSSTYTTVLYVASVALLVPSLLGSSKHQFSQVIQASQIIALLLFIFYLIIVIFQTKTHTHFFKQTARSRIFRMKRKIKENGGKEEDDEEDDYIFDKFNNIGLIISIFVFVTVIAIAAEVFAEDGVILAKEYGISAGISGLIIAIISVSPEMVTAVKAARNDEIQRVINISMGASTVSILITVPVLMFLAFIADIPLALNFNPLEIGALILTIILVWKTTDEGHTNYFEGISHLMFFMGYAIIAAYF